MGPAERRGIDPQQWKITSPKAGTRDPLIIDFDRPMDYALLQDVFQVTGVEGITSKAIDRRRSLTSVGQVRCA